MRWASPPQERRKYHHGQVKVFENEKGPQPKLEALLRL
jgi:hypothetical protein